MEKINQQGIRKKLYTIIFRSDTKWGKLFDLVLLWLIIFSIASVFLESVASIREQHHQLIRTLEWFFTICFTVEYALRVYAIGKPSRYIWSFYGIIDLIAFLPTYLSVFFLGAQYLVVIRALRLSRVFRILKLSRFMSESKVLGTALRGSLHKITVFLACVVTLVTIVGTLMYLIEGEESGFTSIPVSIYWAVVTITTVGYGDISPQTPLGQILASILMITGYGIIAVPTGIVSVEMARATDASKRKCKHCAESLPPLASYCPHCGTPTVISSNPTVPTKK